MYLVTLFFHFFYAFTSICLFSLSFYRYVEKILKIKINTLVTKYTDILIFSFAHIISSAVRRATLNIAMIK